MASQRKEETKKNEIPNTEKGFARVRRNRTRRTVNRHLMTALIVVLLVVIFAVAVVWFFFRVSEIRVNGNTHYNDQDIIDASGIEYDMNIYLVDGGKVSRTLISQFPFIKTVDIRRNVPGTIVIDVEVDEALFYTEIGGEYFIISRELRVLGRETSAEDVAARYPTVKRIITPEVEEAVVGREMVFVRASNFDYIRGLSDVIGASDVYEGLTTIDVSDKFSIKVIYDHKVKASLGDSSNFDLKLRFLGEIIKDLGGAGGTVDIENVEMGYYIPSDGESFD